MSPLGDSPNPKAIAWMTWVLIAANVAVYVILWPQMETPADPNDPRYEQYVEALESEGRLAPGDEEILRQQLTEYDLTVFEYGSRPADWTWFTMFTSMFLHGGFMHLFGNMLFLWIYGNNVEHRLGRILYLLAYLGTGFLASFGDIALRPDSQVPGVGASGAISGVLGAYFIWFPKNKIKLLIMMPPAARVIDVGARLVLGFYIVAQNIIPAFLSYGSGGGGVAHGAHIGGFIGGIVVAFVGNWTLRRVPAEDGGPAEQRKLEELDAPEAVRLGNTLAERGDSHGALAAYERAVADEPYGEHGVDAHLGAARVLAGNNQPTMAYQHLVAAVESGPSQRQLVEARETMAEIRPQVRSVPDLASRFVAGV